MTDPTPASPPPLPRREPRPLLVHAAIDVGVVFLASVIVLLILDVSIWVVVGLAVVVGIAAAPFTRQAERRALERRPASDPPDGKKPVQG